MFYCQKTFFYLNSFVDLPNCTNNNWTAFSKVEVYLSYQVKSIQSDNKDYETYNRVEELRFLNY